MKSAAAIFFLVLLVSTQTPAGQLFKLPNLVEHFVKHKKQSGISFMDFLQDHYSSSHKDGDLPEDEQLPFKNITSCTMGYAIVPGIIKANTLVRLHPGKKAMVADMYILQQYLASIFHPPRV